MRKKVLLTTVILNSMNKLYISDSSKLFFTSDTHFFHQFISDLRGFSSIGEMNDSIINAWNSRVNKDDIVVHLGDFSFGKYKETNNLINRLNGNIHLVIGNHDNTQHINRVYSQRFKSINDLLKIFIQDDNNQYIVACHYPLITWDRAHIGSWHIHGHCHGQLALDSKRLDVGWDAWHNLMSYSSLKDIMSVLSYTEVDHHKNKD